MKKATLEKPLTFSPWTPLSCCDGGTDHIGKAKTPGGDPLGALVFLPKTAARKRNYPSTFFLDHAKYTANRIALEPNSRAGWPVCNGLFVTAVHRGLFSIS